MRRAKSQPVRRMYLTAPTLPVLLSAAGSGVAAIPCDRRGEPRTASMTFRDLPIRQKLTLVTVASSIVVLAIATAAFVAYELVTFRHGMVRKLSTEAEILGENTASAVVFDDDDAARKTLEAFRAEPHVLAAVVYRRDGTEFAAYLRPDLSARPEVLREDPAHRGSWHRFVPAALLVASDILL